jgi:hypothetical protein
VPIKPRMLLTSALPEAPALKYWGKIRRREVKRRIRGTAEKDVIVSELETK